MTNNPFGTFPLDEQHFAPSANVGAKAKKCAIHKYYEKLYADANFYRRQEW